MWHSHFGNASWDKKQAGISFLLVVEMLTTSPPIYLYAVRTLISLEEELQHKAILLIESLTFTDHSVTIRRDMLIATASVMLLKRPFVHVPVSLHSLSLAVHYDKIRRMERI